MKVFHNPEYNRNEDVYLVYLDEHSIFIFCNKIGQAYKGITLRVMTINESNIDTFAHCRGFEDVVSSDSDAKNIVWYNGYDSKKEEIHKIMRTLTDNITRKMKWRVESGMDPTLPKAYRILNLFNAVEA